MHVLRARFPTYAGLREHLLTHRTVCRTCNRAFTRRANLLTRKCVTADHHSCESCRRTFSTRCKLKRHLRETSCSQPLPPEPKRQMVAAREEDSDDLTEPPPQQDPDLQDVLTQHWSSIRSHVARGPIQLPMLPSAYRAKNVLFRCFNTDNANALIRGYKSLVRPLLEYCSTVWNQFIHAKYYLGMTDELDNIQRYFTRRPYYRCRLDCNHDYLERMNQLQLESLELRRIYNDMTMVFKDSTHIHKLR